LWAYPTSVNLLLLGYFNFLGISLWKISAQGLASHPFSLIPLISTEDEVMEVRTSLDKMVTQNLERSSSLVFFVTPVKFEAGFG
jgi:hypothetical protein